jgi:hypothetical protein
MKYYICDCGERYLDPSAISLCASNNHGQPRRNESAELIQRIKDALGTAEDGEALVEVALNAHAAEMELAGIKRRAEYDND